MEPRKVIQFGNSSYVVTLPLDWVKKNNLDKGSTINLSENNDSLILTLDNKKEEKTAVISLENMPLKLFNKELISYYLKNYKYIKISCKNCIERLEEIRILKEKLSSVEIVEINKDHILLEDLTSPNELDVKKIMQEIIEMEKILFEELTKNDSDNRNLIISNLDSNINKLTFLAYKSINYNLDVWKNPSEVKDAIHYRRIIQSFEDIGDIIKRLSRYIKDDKENLSEVFTLINGVHNYFDFITSLIQPDVNLDNNLRIYLDKKQSILKEFEMVREKLDSKNINNYVVMTQLLKDILGDLDTIILSVIDLNIN